MRLTLLLVGFLLILVAGFFVLKNNNCLTVYAPTYLPQGDSISQKRVDMKDCPKAVSFVGTISKWEAEEKNADEGVKIYRFNTSSMKFEERNGRKYTFVNDRDNKPSLLGFIENTFVFITNSRTDSQLSEEEMVKIFEGLEKEPFEIKLPNLIDLAKIKLTFPNLDKVNIKKNYTRNYPQVIKSTFNPGKDHVDTLLTTYLDKTKEVGFNTITIYVLHQYDNGVMKVVSPVGGPHFSNSADGEHIDMIEEAKSKGFAVYLGLEFGGGHNPTLGVPQQQFLDDTKKAALKWADIGERYKVEYFAPATEMDFHINKEYFTNSPQSTERVVEIVNRFHQDLLAELRTIFKGKLVYQHASFTSTDVDGTGYDFVGPDFGPSGMDLERFRSETRKYLNNASLVARKSNTNWIIPEFGVAFKRPDKNNPQGGESLKNSQGEDMGTLQDEYFQIFIEEYMNLKGEPKPKGVGIFSYIHPISSIKDRPAEQIIKKFFSEI